MLRDQCASRGRKKADSAPGGYRSGRPEIGTRDSWAPEPEFRHPDRRASGRETNKPRWCWWREGFSRDQDEVCPANRGQHNKRRQPAELTAIRADQDDIPAPQAAEKRREWRLGRNAIRLRWDWRRRDLEAAGR